MSEEKPVSASRLQLSIGLAIQLLVLAAGGYSMVARLDQRLANVEAAVQPVGPALIEAAKVETKLETLTEEIRRLERDVTLNESRIRTLQIELGVQEEMRRSQ